jgi:hypothetical protein
VQEQGVSLGLQGTVAGVGDLVEARKLDWSLAGYEGNRRGPINRETYQVIAVRDDGGLDVASTKGEPLVLPVSYVDEHLALAYASTVHSAQGSTVDSTHAVITPNTSLAALYVALSRGREANTAHVVTVHGVEDPAQGRDEHALHRDPIAVLARLLDTSDQADAATRSALATAVESPNEAGNLRAPAELLADAAHLAATERTVGWLDQLVDDGLLPRGGRARIAAEDGAASLTRVLRRAEIAGHDPRAVLHDALADRPLDGARNLANVIHARIRDAHRYDPAGETWADWTPRTHNLEWNTYLAALAEAADQRTATLGREAAERAPRWATDAFGPVPEDATERGAWEQQVGKVAAYRELRGHDDDTDALGRAPAPGQVEAYAAYRAAWRALGRPEIDQAAHELSDGQLRVRMRAWQRELPWAPRYVANELAGTRQAAAARRQTASLPAAEAQAHLTLLSAPAWNRSPARLRRSRTRSTPVPTNCRSSTTPAPGSSPTRP